MFSETAEESMIFTPDLCPVAPDLTGRTVLDDLYDGLLKVKGQVVERPHRKSVPPFTFTFSHLADAFVQSDVQGRE